MQMPSSQNWNRFWTRNAHVIEKIEVPCEITEKKVAAYEDEKLAKVKGKELFTYTNKASRKTIA